MPLRQVLEGWDAVVLDWDLDPGERSALIGGFRGGPINEIESYELLCGEIRMRLLVELAPVLSRTLGHRERVRAWLRRANVNLGGRSPVDVMARSPEWVRWFIDHVGLGT